MKNILDVISIIIIVYMIVVILVFGYFILSLYNFKKCYDIEFNNKLCEYYKDY